MRKEKLLAIIHASSHTTLSKNSKIRSGERIQIDEEASIYASKLLNFFKLDDSQQERIELSSHEIPLLF
jgi:hypothetical protein